MSDRIEILGSWRRAARLGFHGPLASALDDDLPEHTNLPDWQIHTP